MADMSTTEAMHLLGVQQNRTLVSGAKPHLAFELSVIASTAAHLLEPF